MQYPINEIFYSIQGEAHFAGLPSVFVRFQGCDVGCAFCDTKHTWKLTPGDKVETRDILGKTGDLKGWAYFGLSEILAAIYSYPNARHVVFTGGEPAQYDLRPLISDLEQGGYTIQIETSATEPLLVSENTWVTVSPKIDMPGMKKICADVVKRANEIKMPIGKEKDIVKFREFLKSYDLSTDLIWLQPISCSQSATQLCIKEALGNNWRVSTQIHKFINVR